MCLLQFKLSYYLFMALLIKVAFIISLISNNKQQNIEKTKTAGFKLSLLIIEINPTSIQNINPSIIFIFRNMWSVWRTVLEENEKLAGARLAAVEVFQQKIADDAKVLRAHKLQIAKKVSEIITLTPFPINICP